MNVFYNISQLDTPFPKGGRIVSLVPSQTELLFDLGLSDSIVGVTKFCIHPKEARKKAIIGGTKQVDFAKIADLNPHVIIGNKEENAQDFMEQLALKYPVFMSDIFTLDDAYTMIRGIGDLTHTTEKAVNIIEEIEHNFANFAFKKSLSANDAPHKTCLYLIWQQPYMAAAGNTFIDDMLQKAGLRNVLTDSLRYPALTPDEIAELQPDYIFLSSEPFPFKEKHIAALREICPNAAIRLVDGELFSWYGSRLRDAPAYFASLHSQNKFVATE